MLVLLQGSPRREDDRGDPDLELAKLTTAVEVERVSSKLAEKWVTKRAQDRGVRLTAEAVAHLVKAVDGDLGAARSELDKLAGLGGGADVTVDQVTALLGIRHGETPADWCDAVLRDQPGIAAAMLPHLLDQTGVNGVGLVIHLGTHLIGLGVARAHYDRGQRGGGLHGAVFNSILKARPAGRLDYKGSAARWSVVAGSWPTQRIDAAIGAALRTDQRLKSTALTDERGVLVDLIMQLTHRNREAA